MRRELAQKLFDKYPTLFRKTSSPFNEHEFECGDGWYEIIDNACLLITQAVRNNESSLKRLQSIPAEYWCTDPSIAYKNKSLTEQIKEEEQLLLISIDELPVIAQIKEKFGNLIIFTDRCNDYQRGVFDMVEAMSSFICEKCGCTGKTYEIGWHRTLCETHAKLSYTQEQLEKYNNKFK